MSLEQAVREVLEAHMGPDEVLQYSRISRDLATRIERSWKELISECSDYDISTNEVECARALAAFKGDET